MNTFNGKKIDFSLYLCTDRQLMSTDTLEEAVELALLGGAGVVQLREKDCGAGEFLRLAKEIKKVTDRYNVPLIINDRVDIALLSDAAGVHLGQSDIPCADARRVLGNGKLIGLSAATVEEAKKAMQDGADYLGVGAMFHTGTKTNTRSVSKDLLARIKASVDIPVVAIGGINAENAGTLTDTGIDGVAVVSAVIAAKDIRGAAEKLKKVFE